MAEERLIDDDKDKKYKIRINEDGEEELYIETQPDEEAEFEVPQVMYDDPDAESLDPEAYAERIRAREEEEARRNKELADRLSLAEKNIAEGDFSTALYNLEEAENCGIESGKMCILKARAVAGDLKEPDLNELAKAVDAVNKYASDEEKAELDYIADKLAAALEEDRQRAEKLGAENEEKKAERRGLFLQKRKKSLINFAITCVPMVVFAVVAAIFASMMYAREDGLNVVLMIVFAAVAGVFLIASLFTARFLWKAVRNVRLNEKNSATKLGREYEAVLAEINKLDGIYAAITVKKESL